MSSRQEAKNEKILKGLLKQPENRQCANCGSLGPQYVIIDFNIFVCTVCSGIHRNFNHRCKGITMATFKAEEIAAIQQGGNAAALAQYLAKWTPRDLAKPTDRRPEQIRDWIDAVYKQKRFYDPAGHIVPPQAVVRRTSSTASSRTADDIPSRPVSEVLGQEPLRLQVSTPLNGSTTSDAFQPAPSTGSQQVSATAHAGPQRGAPRDDLLSEMGIPMPGPMPSRGSTPAPANGGSWDAFGSPNTSQPAPAHPGSPPAGAAAPQGAQVPAWAAFGDRPSAAGSAPSSPAVATPPSASAAGAQWQAFDAPAAPGPVQQQQQQLNTTISNASSAPSESAKPIMKELPSDLFTEMLQPPPGLFAQRGFGPGPQQQARPPAGYQQPPRGFPQQFPQQSSGGFTQPGNGLYPASGGGPRPHVGAPQQYPGAFQQQPGSYQLLQQQPGAAFGQPQPQQSRPPFQPQYGGAGQQQPQQQQQYYQQPAIRPGPGQGGFGGFQEQLQPQGLPNGAGPMPGHAFGGSDPFGSSLSTADAGQPAVADPFSGLVPGMRAALPQVQPQQPAFRPPTPSISPQSSLSSASWAPAPGSVRASAAPQPPSTPPRQYSAPHPTPGSQQPSFMGQRHAPPAAAVPQQPSWQSFDSGFGGQGDSFEAETNSFPSSGVSAFSSPTAQQAHRASLDQVHVAAPSKSGNPFA